MNGDNPVHPNTPEPPMNLLAGQMMQIPLLISHLITHAARHSGDTEIVSRRV